MGVKQHHLLTGDELHPPKDHTHTESQITDLDHNAQEIKGKTITPTWTTDYILVYNGTQWVMELKSSGGASSLNDLSDVTIATPASGDTLIHDGTDFKNTNIDERIKAINLVDFTEKNPPVGADILLIEDSAASYANKKVQVGNIPIDGGAF